MRKILLVSTAMLLSGCTVGPDFKTPEAPSAQGYTAEGQPAPTASAATPLGQAQHFDPRQDIQADWWALFKSPALNSLIEHALAANPTIDSAQAALRQARELVRAQQGAYYPQVSGGLSASRNLTPTASLSPASASGNPYYSLITAQLSVSYTPDVFGLNRRTVETLAAQAEMQRFQLEATYLTLTSNVVAAAVQEASLRGQIEATAETVRIEAHLTDILRQQFALGQATRGDVAAQEAALAQAQQALPPLQKQLAVQRDLLTALAGRLPNEEIAEHFNLADFQLPTEIPLTLPSTLVEHRPDIRAALETLHAASAQVGVAIANRLPQFTLSATGGSQPNSIGNLFTPGTGFWTLAGGLTQPIFDAGTLQHRQYAAQAGFDQAAAEYRSTVISALQNVADSLRALQYDADALTAAVASERAAALSLEIAKRQLQLGAVPYLALLNAEQTYQTSRLSLVQAQAGRLADTAALFQALGGGWWNRTEAPPAD
jgi:NodT family efflux transporter outer membrane factor (OMF) lipoprotein